MKVIKTGNIKLYHITCQKCNSVIEFSDVEEQYKFDSDSFMGMSEDWYINCPICKTGVPTRSSSYYGYFDWRKKV